MNPTDDMHERLRPSDEQMRVAQGLIDLGFAYVFVPIALPRKTRGVWTHAQTVQQPNGFFPIKADDDAGYRAARDAADWLAGSWLQWAKVTGESCYCVISNTDGEPGYQVIEGIYGPKDGAL